MAHYMLSWSDGRQEYDAPETCAEAVARVKARYPEYVLGEWEQESPFSPRKRCLVWASEEEAEGDDGYNAVAEILAE